MKEFDFVVIGSGIAGLTFALKAAKHGRVAIITKRKGADSNTAWAQGGVACVTSGEDSFELHMRDTLEAGAGLCDPAAVETVVTEGPKRIRELIELGLHFDERDVSGHRELDLGRETPSGGSCTCTISPATKSRRRCSARRRNRLPLTCSKITWRSI